MTTQPGWEPRPGPTRGETARRAPRGAAGGWPDDPARRRAAARTAGADRARTGPSAAGSGGPSRAPGSAQRARLGGPRDRGRGGSRPPREPRQRLGDGAPGGPGRSPLRWIGALSTRNAMLALVAGTVIGIVATLVAGTEPGFLLGFFIVIGAVVGDAGGPARSRLPVLPAARLRLLPGRADNRQDPRQHPVVVDGGAGGGLHAVDRRHLLPDVRGHDPGPADRRRPLAAVRQLVGGQFTMSADRPVRPQPPSPPAAAPGPDIDPWNDQNSGQEPARPATGQGALVCPDGAGPARPARKDRDPWNDPRPAADPRTAADPPPTAGPPGRNVPPSRNVPPASRRAARPARRAAHRNPPAPPPARPTPAARPAPGDRAPRPPAPPRPGPQRPTRPPQDQWDQR